MDAWLNTLLIIAELLIIIVIGFLVGKFLHLITIGIIKKVAAKTATIFDDLIIEHIENPLKMTITIISTYVLTGFFGNLAFVHEALIKYTMSILILLGAYILAETIGAILDWYYIEGIKTTKTNFDITILPFIRKASRIVIILIGLTVSLSLVGIDVTAIFAITSVVGIILGLASQETLANIFAGMALQLDRPCNYGDHIRMITGDILKLRKIGTRSTKLEDLDGNMVVISNSEFAKQRITNVSRNNSNFKASVPADIPIKTDLNRLEKFLSKEIEKENLPTYERGSLKIIIDKVGKDSLSILINFNVKAHVEAKKIKAVINRKMVEFMLA